MTLAEFKEKYESDPEWAPGWEAIDAAFDRIYQGQNPAHYATNVTARAMFGGDSYLDGYSVYDSPKGYKHIVTYGMSELYYNEKSFGGEWSRWGYEMTIKLAETDNENCLWALNLLSNLARYTFTSKQFFEPEQYVAGNGTSLCIGRESAITALVIASDTEAAGVDTVYGRLDFVQLVGITQREFEAVKGQRDNIRLLLEHMKEDNPDLVTDLNRTKSYL
ncbi:MAG: suppressor of fused domain protein [bacterium]|nr:suppressor of fused domain protein [bacterium]MCM1376769.1 suppressor of fused domain protein [Muribaculum sp.]